MRESLIQAKSNATGGSLFSVITNDFGRMGFSCSLSRSPVQFRAAGFLPRSRMAWFFPVARSFFNGITMKERTVFMGFPIRAFLVFLRLSFLPCGYLEIITGEMMGSVADREGFSPFAGKWVSPFPKLGSLAHFPAR